MISLTGEMLIILVFTTIITITSLLPSSQYYTAAQRPGLGTCPDPPTIADFDLKKFQGRWYEVERSFYLYEIASHCVNFNFTLTNNGFYKVLFSMKNRITQNLNTYVGRAVPWAFNPAIIDYRADTRLPTAVARILPGSGRYYILSTDYDNYAIMWSCSNLGFLYADLIWVLGRETDFSPNVRVQVYEELKELGLDKDRLVISKHADCPTY